MVDNWLLTIDLIVTPKNNESVLMPNNRGKKIGFMRQRKTLSTRLAAHLKNLSGGPAPAEISKYERRSRSRSKRRS